MTFPPNCHGVLLPVYLQGHASRLMVEEIPLEMVVAWLVAVILSGMEGKAAILQAELVLQRVWQK